MKSKDLPSRVNGFTPVELKLNIMTPCGICHKKEKIMWYKLETKTARNAEIRCFEHVQEKETGK